jgi:putative membrane protein
MRTTTLVTALSMTVLAACAKGDKTANDSAVATDTAAATTASANAPVPTLTDADIGAVLDAVNAADSSFGKLASTKGTNKDVRAFGVLMMKDHHAMRKAGQDVFTKLGVTPALPANPVGLANDSLPMKVKKISDSLNVLAKGPPFDMGYIGDEVSNHQSVLSFIDEALGATQTAQVKDLLTKARPIVAMHLKRAQDIQTKLGSAQTP